MLVISLCVSAWAAEVVWLGELPDAEVVADVARFAGAERPPLRPIDLRAAGSAATPADGAAWTALATALRDVRPYETRLDGELVILRDLERPIAGLTLIPDATARTALYEALVYQGFAAWRLYGESLATDPDAGPWRSEVLTGAVPRPWSDAVALIPERRPSAYELAEAGARSAFTTLAPLVSGQLPATVVVGALPAGASFVVDGVVTDPGPTASVKLVPGRHLAHVVLDGEIIERFDLRLQAAEARTVEVALTDAVWTAWLREVSSGNTPVTPASVGPRVEALGGDVLLAWTDGRRVRALRVDATGSRVEVVRTSDAPDASALRAGVAVAVGGGWLNSGDFYLQDPVNVPHTRAAVNAGTVGVLVEAHLSKGLFRATAGVDQVVTLGADHAALSGNTSLRYRPAPYVGVGVPWAQVVGGYLFPYHPAVGAHATIPAYKGLEIVGSFLAGLPGTLTRDDGTTYDALPVYSAWVGVGWRYGGR